MSLSTTDPVATDTTQITIHGLLTADSAAVKTANSNKLSVLSEAFPRAIFPGIIAGTNVQEAVAALVKIGFSNLTLNNFTQYINPKVLQGLQVAIDHTYSITSSTNASLINNLSTGSYSITNVALSSDGTGINVFADFKLGFGAQQATITNIKLSFTPETTPVKTV